VAIVTMLADDALGAARERPPRRDGSEPGDALDDAYVAAFRSIDGDPNQELVVGELEVGSQRTIAATLHLTILPSLTYVGRPRAQIEAVRVAARHRNLGLGHQLFEWAIDRARARGCHMVQLTTDRARPDAARFYEALGFVPSHLGMKLAL